MFPSLSFCSLSIMKYRVTCLWLCKRWNVCIMEHIWGPEDDLHSISSSCERVEDPPPGPTFCHWLGPFDRVPFTKLNPAPLLFLSFQPNSPLPSLFSPRFVGRDRSFRQAPTWNHLLIYTSQAICTQKSPSNKQKQSRHTNNHTHTHISKVLKWNWNESTITVSILI